jgi:hypothetical protein
MGNVQALQHRPRVDGHNLQSGLAPRRETGEDDVLGRSCWCWLVVVLLLFARSKRGMNARIGEGGRWS